VLRHEERGQVLGRKLDALQAERALCQRDLEDMERGLASAVEAGAETSWRISIAIPVKRSSVAWRTPRESGRQQSGWRS
jgi:hypothetical protein